MKPLVILPLLLLHPDARAISPSGAMPPKQLNPDRFQGTSVGVSNGDDLDVTFSNPALAGRKVTVVAKHPNGKLTVEFDIQLDSNGRGTKKWRVPNGWPGVLLTEPTSADHGVIVVP